MQENGMRYNPNAFDQTSLCLSKNDKNSNGTNMPLKYFWDSISN